MLFCENAKSFAKILQGDAQQCNSVTVRIGMVGESTPL